MPVATRQPAIVSYIATFLPPEMRHVYRQVSNISSFRNIVVTRTRRHRREFPYEPIYQLNKSPWRWLPRLAWRVSGKTRPITAFETRQMEEICQWEKVGLVHIYLGSEAARLKDWMAATPLPVVVSFHGADLSDQVSDRDLQGVFEHATLLLHRSNSLRRVLLSRGAPEDKLRPNPTGVPLPTQENIRSRSPSESLRLLQACRFIPKKGLDTTLRAVANLAQAGHPVELTLAGSGPEETMLRTLAANLAISDRITWRGFLRESELAAEYARADVFLHPSRETGSGDREGIPNALLEAMAMGKLVISTRHSGIPEAIVHGQNGYLMDDNAPESLAKLIELARNDPGKTTAMGHAARKSIESNFSVKQCVATLQDAYREAMLQRDQ